MSTAPGAAASRRRSTSSVESSRRSSCLNGFESTVAEIPTVELLQEPGCSVLPELSAGLADEQDELGDDFLASRLDRTAVDDLLQGPWISLGAATDHDRSRPGRREDGLRLRSRGDIARCDHGNV